MANTVEEALYKRILKIVESTPVLQTSDLFSLMAAIYALYEFRGNNMAEFVEGDGFKSRVAFYIEDAKKENG
jgi:hypothetical protein